MPYSFMSSKIFLTCYNPTIHCDCNSGVGRIYPGALEVAPFLALLEKKNHTHFFQLSKDIFCQFAKDTDVKRHLYFSNTFLNYLPTPYIFLTPNKVMMFG